MDEPRSFGPAGTRASNPRRTDSCRVAPAFDGDRVEAGGPSRPRRQNQRDRTDLRARRMRLEAPSEEGFPPNSANCLLPPIGYPSRRRPKQRLFGVQSSIVQLQQFGHECRNLRHFRLWTFPTRVKRVDCLLTRQVRANFAYRRPRGHRKRPSFWHPCRGSRTCRFAALPAVWARISS